MGFFEIFSAALSGFFALVPSLGLAIILLTVAVRLLLLPLSLKQTRSMREMQRIQPEVKKLQQKHKGDRQKMNEELMKLYKEHGVNPFGGCAPLLLQFPVLIGLFYVIRTPLAYMGYTPARNEAGRITEWTVNQASNVPDAIQNSALAHGLNDMASTLNHFLGIRLDCHSQAALAGDAPSGVVAAPCGDGFVSAIPYLVLVLLMGFTTWYQQKQMQSKQDPANPQAAQMQMFARIMPVMLMFFAFTFPSGVVLYWLTTNLWTIGQQRVLLGSVPSPAGGGGNGTARPGKEATKPQTGKPARGSPAKPASEGSGDGARARPHPSSKKKRRR
ncbi:MAG: YidC/Oxa1 family membrane protein insertase [Actinomycetota bacterium]